MRISIKSVLKAGLAIAVMIACASGVILLLQAVMARTPASTDSDGDGFLDVNENGWWTSVLDKNDNPITTRVLPAVLIAMALAFILVLRKSSWVAKKPNIVPYLREKLRILKDDLQNGNIEATEACIAEIDVMIVKLRASHGREALLEPVIQDLLIEFELCCFDAFNSTKSKGIEEKPGEKKDPLASNKGQD